MGKKRPSVKKMSAKRYAKIPPERKKAWLMKNPKMGAGRPPLYFTSLLRPITQDEVEGLVVACIQVLLEEKDKRPIERRTIILKVPFDFQSRQTTIQNGRLVKTSEDGWWEFYEYNPARILDRLYVAGLTQINFRDFLQMKKNAVKLLLDIESTLDKYTPSQVFENFEEVLNDCKNA